MTWSLLNAMLLTQCPCMSRHRTITPVSGSQTCAESWYSKNGGKIARLFNLHCFVLRTADKKIVAGPSHTRHAAAVAAECAQKRRRVCVPHLPAMLNQRLQIVFYGVIARDSVRRNSC